MMLAETGSRTGGVCMRCFGTEREDSRATQTPSRAPTTRAKKYALALTKLDLETFSVWVRCADDDDKVRPASVRALDAGVEFVAAAKLKFADGSEHFGGVEVIRTNEGHTVAGPFLLHSGTRINFTDHTSEYSFAKMTPKLAEELRRKYFQNQARLERQIGRSLPKVFPVQFELLTSLTPGKKPLAGELPVPTFQLPNIAGDER
jgi:hypothetical protein